MIARYTRYQFQNELLLETGKCAAGLPEKKIEVGRNPWTPTG
ncbi:protein of unknown function (plasmid) [Paraburkholderia dioscoreae]|uniref:Uncharacterized protein n=1 Tax=Paraburkholderia dioscoreae TaxID=2604047 RepID=A0A5Q4YUW0_9BURK|nr:protein of unknown function [Paraburkholderia dioscoreae]